MNAHRRGSAGKGPAGHHCRLTADLARAWGATPSDSATQDEARGNRFFTTDSAMYASTEMPS